MEQYTIKIRRLKDGTISINNGFNAFEVLGFIDITKGRIFVDIHIKDIKK